MTTRRRRRHRKPERHLRMRQVVLDTETTGLEVGQGHRIIEIGCVELVNRRRTNRTFHHYLRPDREIDEAAQEIHGISQEDLADKLSFADVADDFLTFITGAELVIHNADFDVGFVDQEMRLAGLQARIQDCCTVIDTLSLARQLHPGQRNSLDALCKRYRIDNSRRDFHGALLDAQLLADVYLAMTGGQGKLSLDAASGGHQAGSQAVDQIDREGLNLVVVRATRAEQEAHERQLDIIDTACPEGALWRRLDS